MGVALIVRIGVDQEAPTTAGAPGVALHLPRIGGVAPPLMAAGVLRTELGTLPQRRKLSAMVLNMVVVPIGKTAGAL